MISSNATLFTSRSPCNWAMIIVKLNGDFSFSAYFPSEELCCERSLRRINSDSVSFAGWMLPTNAL